MRFKKFTSKYYNLILNSIGVFFLILSLSAIINTLYVGNYQGILWLCYPSLFIISIGILKRNNLTILTQLNILVLPLIVWGIDFSSYFYLGRTLFGMTDYMFIYGITVGKIISFQHLFTIPLSIFAIILIRTNKSTSFKFKDSRKISYLQLLLIFIITRLLTLPENNINCIYEPCMNLKFSSNLYFVYWFFYFFAMVLITNLILAYFFEQKSDN